MKINDIPEQGRPAHVPLQLIRIMKLTAIIITFCLLQVSAATKAQITLNEKKAPLQKVLESISTQSGYDFIYSTQDLKDLKTGTIKLNNVDIETALKAAFDNQPLQYEIADKTVMVKRKEEKAVIDRVKDFFASIDVRGHVVDEKGLPLPGVTVKLKDESQVTITDKDGNFILKKANENAVIIISYIGYLTKEVNASADLGTITLELSNSKLDEVKVIAYGQTTERLSTGNIASVRSADIEKQPVNNPLYALQGRVAGVIVTPSSGLPGSPVTIQIRGQNSLNQQSDPLYIVDGIPYTNTVPTLAGGLGALGSFMSPLNFLNPNDIESISILKDADATAIYGSRGANGVILITTKKGKSGATKVDVNVQSGISEVGKMLKMMNTEQYLSMRKQALANDGISSRLSNPAFSGTYADLMLWDQTRYTDWQKVLIGGTGKYTDAQTSISGGAENVQYLIGGNYHKETTVFPGDNSDRKGGMHFSITGNSPNKKLKATLTGSYMADKSTLPGIDFTGKALTTEPNAPAAYNNDGTINWALYPATGSATTWQGYPYSASLLKQYEITNNNLTSNVDISYQLGPINLKTSAGYNELRGNSFQGSPSTTVPPSLAEAIGDFSRSANFNSSLVKNWNFEPQLTYSGKLFNGTVNFLAGGSIQSSSVGSQYLSLVGFPSDFVLKSMGAASMVYPSNGSSQYKYNAVFTRLSYNFKNKYLLNLNARRDGSSRFGPGSQFGNFGSIGTAWVFSEEDFIKNSLNFLSFGKIRFSYGSSGNDGIGDYQYLETYQPVNGSDQGAVGYKSSGLFNPYYHWETTRKMEFGLETGFLKDRILFSASYFRNRSDNQLINFPFPSMAGYGSLVENLPALIQNTGIEFTLNTINIKSGNWQWSSNINFTSNRNKLIRYPDLSYSPYAQSVIGQPFYGYVDVYRSAGVNPATGLYQFRDINGNIVGDPSASNSPRGGRDIRITTAPKFYGGFSNAVSYKGWNLDVFVQFTKQMGINPLYQSGAYPGTRYNQFAEIFGHQWQRPGDVAEIQEFSTRGKLTIYQLYHNSDQGYTDASFIRIKNVSLSYSLPDKWTDKWHMKKLRIYAQGQNLFTITKYKGFDPETQNLVYLPPLRTITAGLQIGL
jgi:TonB-linked SusC/RagA family outer membrane protein